MGRGGEGCVRGWRWGGVGTVKKIKNKKKDDGDGNSFTAGWPQGSTFSTGILSWK